MFICRSLQLNSMPGHVDTCVTRKTQKQCKKKVHKSALNIHKQMQESANKCKKCKNVKELKKAKNANKCKNVKLR